MGVLPSPIEVFYSYVDSDEDLQRELNTHLSSLRNEGLITVWHKKDIAAGIDFTKIVDQHLNAAGIILLLISSDFLGSDSCYKVEMSQALHRHQRNEAQVIPILLRPCDWESAPFAHLQVLPTNTTPITIWPNRDEAFANVVAGIRNMIKGEPLSLTTDLASLSHLRLHLSREAPHNSQGQRGSHMTLLAFSVCNRGPDPMYIRCVGLDAVVDGKSMPIIFEISRRSFPTNYLLQEGEPLAPGTEHVYLVHAPRLSAQLQACGKNIVLKEAFVEDEARNAYRVAVSPDLALWLLSFPPALKYPYSLF